MFWHNQTLIQNGRASYFGTVTKVNAQVILKSIGEPEKAANKIFVDQPLGEQSVQMLHKGKIPEKEKLHFLPK